MYHWPCLLEPSLPLSSGPLCPPWDFHLCLHRALSSLFGLCTLRYQNLTCVTVICQGALHGRHTVWAGSISPGPRPVTRRCEFTSNSASLSRTSRGISSETGNIQHIPWGCSGQQDSLCSLGAHILGQGVGGGERREEGDSLSDRAGERRRRSHTDEGSK